MCKTIWRYYWRIGEVAHPRSTRMGTCPCLHRLGLDLGSSVLDLGAPPQEVYTTHPSLLHCQPLLAL